MKSFWRVYWLFCVVVEGEVGAWNAVTSLGEGVTLSTQTHTQKHTHILKWEGCSEQAVIVVLIGLSMGLESGLAEGVGP